MTQKNKPTFEIDYGVVKAAIWCNDTEKGKFYSVDIYRVYKDQDDNWQRTSNFGLQDLPKVEKAAAQAYQHIYLLRAESANSDEENS